MPERNDPCPCGSGKKYKRCHLPADSAERPALRLLRARGSDALRVAQSIGNRAIPSIWQADLVPLGATFGDDPNARPTVSMVAAGDLVLHADIVSRAPAEPARIAELIDGALHAATEATGQLPSVVEVRYQVIADALRERVSARKIVVRVSFELEALDRAVTGMEQHMGLPRSELGNRMSKPQTWVAWGLDTDRIAKLFAAAAAYWRAAPWTHLANEDVLRATVGADRTWTAAVLGNGGEVFGLALYERADDLTEILEHAAPRGHRGREAEHSDDMRALARRMRGAVLSLSFGPRAELPSAMRNEVRRAGWEIAAPSAWPLLVMMNTPAGGVTLRQADDLIALLRSIALFARANEAVLSGEEPAAFPLELRDALNDVTLVLDVDDGPMGPAGARGDSGIAPSEEAHILREFMNRHYREWLDIPVPALGHRTPRHAARLKTVRPKLVEILAAIDQQAATVLADGEPMLDADFLWQELGLTTSRRC